ncbi:glycosyltransferase [Raoultella sp. WB_B2P2-3]|uniref:glycosyltransferase n=1 Tax=Raoultella scottii TaxID=3040937 RepID=UPI002F933683
MKNVLFVLPFLGYTGADRVIFTLLNNLDRTKIKPFLLVHSDKEEKSGLIKYLKDDVTVISLGINGRISRNLHKIIYGMRKNIKQYDIDTVLISDGTSNASISPFLFLFGNVKIIARESNLPSLFETKTVVRYLYKNFYSNYDKIIVQSNDMYDDLTKEMHIPASKIVKINNPLDYDFIISKSQEQSSYMLPEDKINLLAIGRLTYQKGFDLLLEGVARLKNDKYHLTIVGQGEDDIKLKDLCVKLNVLPKVTFIDKTDNPYALMKQADIFISSSRWEGYPNVVIEALACGLPVVANDYPGGINEIINDSNGSICDICNDLENNLTNALKLKDISYDKKKIDDIFSAYENTIIS